MKTTEWLDHAKTALQLNSDYQLSKALQTSRARISHYRTGTHTMDDALAVRLAELLGISPARILADIHAERATDPKVKKAWHDIARSIAASILIALPLLTEGGKIFAAQQCILCKLSWLRRFPTQTPTILPA